MYLRSRSMRCALVAIWLIGLHSSGHAQEKSGDGGIRDLMASPAPEEASLEQRLEALIKTTQNAREIQKIRSDEMRKTDAVNSQPERASGSPSYPSWSTNTDSAAPAAKNVEAPSNSTSSASAASSQSLAEIRDRIRILQRLRRNQQLASEARQSGQLPGGSGQAQLKNPSESVLEPAAGSNESGNPGGKAMDPGLAQIDQSLTPTEQTRTSTPDTATQARPSGKRILSKPVNSLALGESLYRTGNYEASLKAFQSVDVTMLTQSDRTWLDLMTALCQRRLGEFATAEGTLRDIANEKSNDYPVLAAKWWLKHATASNETLTKLKALNLEYETLIERSKNHVMQ